GECVMVDVIDSDMSADHWRDRDGKRVEIGEMDLEEEELLDPDALRKVKPEEEFEGYTGNAGMTLDRWYRHGAILLWPDSQNFEILCTTGSGGSVHALERMVEGWREAGPADADARKATALAFARELVAE